MKDDGLLQAYAGLLILALGIMLMCILSGCTTTRYVSVPEYHTDSIYISKVQHDSVYQRDSVFTFIKGDTVTIYKEKLRYKFKTITDTVYAERVDSISIPYEVVREKQLSWVKRVQLETWPILALLILSAVIFYYLRRFFS